MDRRLGPGEAGRNVWQEIFHKVMRVGIWGLIKSSIRIPVLILPSRSTGNTRCVIYPELDGVFLGDAREADSGRPAANKNLRRCGPLQILCTYRLLSSDS